MGHTFYRNPSAQSTFDYNPIKNTELVYEKACDFLDIICWM